MLISFLEALDVSIIFIIPILKMLNMLLPQHTQAHTHTYNKMNIQYLNEEGNRLAKEISCLKKCVDVDMEFLSCSIYTSTNGILQCHTHTHMCIYIYLVGDIKWAYRM